jgi:hypothetical protein
MKYRQWMIIWNKHKDKVEAYDYINEGGCSQFENHVCLGFSCAKKKEDAIDYGEQVLLPNTKEI